MTGAGRAASVQSQAAWLPVLRTLGMLPWFEGRLMISGAGKVFDNDGHINDGPTRDRVRAFAEGFSAFAGIPRR